MPGSKEHKRKGNDWIDAAVSLGAIALAISMAALIVGSIGLARSDKGEDLVEKISHRNCEQLITCEKDTIQAKCERVIFDLVEEPSCSNGICSAFYLGPGEVGEVKEFIVKNVWHIAVRNTNPHDNFYEAHFKKPSESVTLQYLEIGGWTVVSSYGAVRLDSLRNARPDYIHVLCTSRRMPILVGGFPTYANPMCLDCENDRLDYIATIDINPTSFTFGKIVNRANTIYNNQEFHHGHINGDRLFAGSLYGSSVSIYNLEQERRPKLERVIDPFEINSLNLGNIHTIHNLPNGDLVLTALSNATGGGNGGFILLNGDFAESFTGSYLNAATPYFNFGNSASKYIPDSETVNMANNYDIGIKECLATMISTEWTNSSTFEEGFLMGPNSNIWNFGHSIHVWDIKNKLHKQTIDFGMSCIMPLEIRFLRGDLENRAYVSCVLNGETGGSDVLAVFYNENTDLWEAESVISLAPIALDPMTTPISLPDMTLTSIPPTITDITLSQDNRFLYVSAWLHGVIYQYDVSLFRDPILIDTITLGGMPIIQPNDIYVNGVLLTGGPQMLRLNPSGDHLYVTNSLYSKWDQEFYGYMGEGNTHSIDNGSYLARVNTGVVHGVKKATMAVDPTVFIDFSTEPNGPVRAHEVHVKTLGHGH